jgi:acyl-coenzyme A thioesterase PaaI-like protein
MKGADKLDGLMRSAKASKWGLMKFNFIMHRVIPFNHPHKIKVSHLDDNVLRSELPYMRKNLNHLKGIHACAIATLAEYTSGLFLLSKASSSKYRLIMKTLRVEYSYQGRTALTAEFGMTEAELEAKIWAPLKKEGVLLETFEIKVLDAEKNLVAIAYVDWQIKEWNKTKLK